MTTYSPGCELYVNGAWTAVTGDVQYNQRFVITRGRQDEGGQGQPSTCSFVLDNRSDNYTPENPMGTYFGSFGFNTQCRVFLPSDRGMRLVMDPSTGGYANAPDSANLSITGDIDLRADIFLKNWRTTYPITPVYKISSYRLVVDKGFLKLWWQYDSNSGHTLEAQSTVQIPMYKPGRLSIRATLDVDNGASGWAARFYTSTDTGTVGTWTALGDPVTTAGTTAIYDSTGSLFVYSGSLMITEAFSVAVYQGIAGTLRANPRFDQQSLFATSFADAQGNTWTVNTGGARIDDRDYRFQGKLAEIVPDEDPSGNWRWTEITAAGDLRRLLLKGSPTKSAMDGGIEQLDSVAAWWPGEDGEDATVLSSGIASQPDLLIFGSPQLAGNSQLFPGSGPLMVFDNNTWLKTASDLVPYTNSGETQAQFLLHVPTGGYLNNTVLMRFITTGTAWRWDLLYFATGNGGFYLIAYDVYSNVLGTTAAADYGLIDVAKMISLEFTQNGADVDIAASALPVGESVGGITTSTFTGVTFGVVKSIYINPNRADMSDTVFGQVILQNDNTGLFNLVSQLNAYIGEEPDDRLLRHVRTEQRQRFESVGEVLEGDNSGMGYQRQKTLAELMHECEDQDLGILTDMRMFDGGISYRSRDSLYGQDPALTLSYTVGKDLKNLRRATDDKNTANDVTVTRIDGASGTPQQQLTGDLNLSDPPTGVGLYKVNYDVSLATDASTADHASWRLHLGTVAEPRWPLLEIWAERSEVSDVAQAIADIDLGDRIQVTNVPTRRLLWDIDALVVGVTEELDQFQWHHRWITTPERPWRALEWDTDRRYSPNDSTLASSATSTATSLSVATNSGARWVRAADDAASLPFDILVSGERMTVTDVSGTTSPQTFTVTRSVNSIVKAQSSGATVALWDPSYWAL